MHKIDAELENGEKVLKWKSPNIDEYIKNIREKVSDLETRLQKSKLNLEKIKQLMSTWVGTPLFKRYEAKSTLLQLDDKQLRLDNRYKEIRETGNKIQDLIKVIIILNHYFRLVGLDLLYSLFVCLFERKIKIFLK